MSKIKVKDHVIIPTPHFFDRFEERGISSRVRNIVVLMRGSYIMYPPREVTKGTKIRLFNPLTRICFILSHQGYATKKWKVVTTFVAKTDMANVYRLTPNKELFVEWEPVYLENAEV